MTSRKEMMEKVGITLDMIEDRQVFDLIFDAYSELKPQADASENNAQKMLSEFRNSIRDNFDEHQKNEITGHLASELSMFAAEDSGESLCVLGDVLDELAKDVRKLRDLWVKNNAPKSTTSEDDSAELDRDELQALIDLAGWIWDYQDQPKDMVPDRYRKGNKGGPNETEIIGLALSMPKGRQAESTVTTFKGRKVTYVVDGEAFDNLTISELCFMVSDVSEVWTPTKLAEWVKYKGYDMDKGEAWEIVMNGHEVSATYATK